jgi:hypothetical protein
VPYGIIFSAASGYLGLCLDELLICLLVVGLLVYSLSLNSDFFIPFCGILFMISLFYFVLSRCFLLYTSCVPGSTLRFLYTS